MMIIIISLLRGTLHDVLRAPNGAASTPVAEPRRAPVTPSRASPHTQQEEECRPLQSMGKQLTRLLEE